ncbi:Protein of unknown function [Allokutzneria albata]|uniref:DUF3239 domain-containing protein n=1 Tax=Allokutzneria albata TaxID=211114 RepID=A0A1H0BM56_ALLAB|nr:Protein of unknown function [Allokutzneria albata]
MGAQELNQPRHGLPATHPQRYQQWEVDDAHLRATSGHYAQWRAGLSRALWAAFPVLALSAWALTGPWWAIVLGVVGALVAIGGLVLVLAGRRQPWRPYQGGQVVPGVVLEVGKDGRAAVLVMAEMSRTPTTVPRFALRLVQLPGGAMWSPGERIPCVAFDLSGKKSAYWSNFDAAPVSWAIADAQVLREVGSSIDAAEWVLLGDLAHGAGQLKGKDRPMVLPADKLPTELRYPRQRFGIELAWDDRGQPHVSPEAVPVFPLIRGTAWSPKNGQRRLDFQPDRGHARRYNEIYRRGDRPWLLTVGITSAVLAATGASFVLSGQLWGYIAGGALLGLALLGGLFLARARRTNGSPHQYFRRGVLCPGMISHVDSKGAATVLVLADVTTTGDVPRRFALHTLRAENLPGHRIAVGERVPVTCRFSSSPDHPWARMGYWDFVVAVPVAWGTPDPATITRAVEEIDEIEWAYLQHNLERAQIVSGTTDHTILLTHEELPHRLRGLTVPRE